MKYHLMATLMATGFSLSACVVAPQPVTVAPAPVAIGWHGDRYYDGHRYWERKEWLDHQHRHGDGDRDENHCPPGLEKQGRC